MADVEREKAGNRFCRASLTFFSINRALFGIAIAGQLALWATPSFAQTSPSPYTSATRYDALGRVTGTISPDADGVSPWQFLAVRNSYDDWGRLTKVETGSLNAWQSEAVAPKDWELR